MSIVIYICTLNILRSLKGSRQKINRASPKAWVDKVDGKALTNCLKECFAASEKISKSNSRISSTIDTIIGLMLQRENRLKHSSLRLCSIINKEFNSMDGIWVKSSLIGMSTFSWSSFITQTKSRASLNKGSRSPLSSRTQWKKFSGTNLASKTWNPFSTTRSFRHCSGLPPIALRNHTSKERHSRNSWIAQTTAEGWEICSEKSFQQDMTFEIEYLHLEVCEEVYEFTCFII